MNTVAPRLSPNFTLAEATASSTAERLNLLNTPPTSALLTMQETARYMEVIRAILNSPINVSSWYRCPALNKAVGSKDTSQHRLGEAVDFKSPEYGSPLYVCKAIMQHRSVIPFDQLILEHSWVHISFSILNGNPRGQVLSLLSSGHFASGLTDAQGVPYK